MVRTMLVMAVMVCVGCGDSTGNLVNDERGTAGSSLDQARRAWFAPNVGARDTLQLFEDPGSWEQARARLGVFQLYAQNLTDDCAGCGEVVFPGLQRVDAFRKLKAWDVALAIEVGSVKHHTCQGERSADFTAGLVARVAAAGGEVGFIAMDEPYAGGDMQVGAENCRYSRDQSADEVARFVQRLRERSPGVRVGDIEPYPFFKVAELMAWVDAVQARGADLAFFHVDIDRNHVKSARADVWGDMGRLRTFLAERQIPMGIIFQGHELEVPTRTDAQYYDVVLKHAQDTRTKVGTLDHVIVQSWFQVNGQNTLPANLPFAGKGHTRLLFEIAGVFGLTGGGPAPTPTPTPTPNADAATVKTMRAYLGVLGREGDAGGVASWSASLRSGKSAAWLCGGLADSDEFRVNRGGLSSEELAAELYRGILGREGDPDGLASTAADVRAGRLALRAGAMLDSAEFRERFLP